MRHTRRARALALELVADARSTRLPAAVAVGLFEALRRVISALSLSAIIFTGPLAVYVVQGAGPLLFGACALAVVAALTGGFRGGISSPISAPAAAMYSVGLVVGPGMAHSPDAAFVTMLAIMGLSSVATALCFLLVGRFGLADLFRFVPYPVTGGFLAGLGWTMVTGGVAAMSGIVLRRETIPLLFDVGALVRWAPGVAIGIALLVVTKRQRHFLIYPAAVVLVTAVYHMVLYGLGMSVAEGSDAGFLVAQIPPGALWPPVGSDELVHVDWQVVASQLPGVLGVVLIMLVFLVLAVGSVEASTGVELDLNREFRSEGLACLIGGLGGSTPGCSTAGRALISLEAGADTRWTGIITGLAVGAVMLLGGRVVSIFPMALVGGLIVFVGVRLLHDWLIVAPRRLPRADFAAVLLIAGVVGAVGFLEGFAVGLVVAGVFFVVRFSRVEVVGDSFTGGDRRSRRIRPYPDHAILRSERRRIRVYRLRGYLFFGSASSLGDRLKAALRADPAPRCLLLDFGDVTGFDVSANHAFCRVVRFARDTQTRVVLSATTDIFRSSMRRHLPERVFGDLFWEQDLDHGLERCEDILIGEWTQTHSAVRERQDAAVELLYEDALPQPDRQTAFEALIERLEPWLETRSYDAGQNLAVRGEKPDGVQLLLGGRAVARSEGDETRLLEYGPGDAITPRAAFGDHVAETTIVAEVPCRAALMTAAARSALEEQDPPLALAMDRHLIRSIV